MTTRILIRPEEAVLPTSNSASLSTVTSSGSQPTNAPAMTYKKIAFAHSAVQSACWNLALPADFLSAPVLTLYWDSAGNAGNVVWTAGLAPIALNTAGSPGNMPAGVYLNADSFGALTVPATAGEVKQSSQTLTSTGMTAGEMLGLFISRLGTSGPDTSTSNAELLGAVLSYTS